MDYKKTNNHRIRTSYPSRESTVRHSTLLTTHAPYEYLVSLVHQNHERTIVQILNCPRLHVIAPCDFTLPNHEVRIRSKLWHTRKSEKSFEAWPRNIRAIEYVPETFQCIRPCDLDNEGHRGSWVGKKLFSVSDRVILICAGALAYNLML